MGARPEFILFMLPGEMQDDTLHNIQNPKQLLLRVMLGRAVHALAEHLSTWRSHETEIETWCGSGTVEGELGQFREVYCNVAASIPYLFHTIAIRADVGHALTFSNLEGASLSRLTFLPCDALELYRAWEHTITQGAECPPPVLAFLNRVLGGNVIGVAVGAGALLTDAVVNANTLAERAEAIITANPVRVYDEREYMPV